MQIYLDDTEATESAGKLLWQQLPEKCLIFLHGQLGAGKTTLVRGFLKAAGHVGAVKSPTYTLVEEYDIAGRTLYHFDLYRLSDPEELEWIGLEDYLAQDAICLIEWPEMGEGVLPQADLELFLQPHNQGRMLILEPMLPELKKFLKLI